MAKKKPMKKQTVKKSVKKSVKKPMKKATPKAAKKTAPKAVKVAKKTKAVAAKKPAPNEASTKAKSAKRSVDLSSVFTPLDDRILVERMRAAERTPGGLYIPDSVASGDRPNQGRVVAVGRGHLSKKGRVRPLDVHLGDEVMFNNFAGSEVQIESQDYLLLREDEIIAVLK